MANKIDKYAQFFEDIRPGDIAIDCGANVGHVTARMAGRGARVYAFEPNPFAFSRLAERFRGNPDVVCLNKAVLDRDAVVKLYFHENSDEDEVRWSTGSSLLDFKGNVRRDKFQEVEAVDLAAFIMALDAPVALLKIDVEGVECPILDRLVDLGLNERIGHVLVETHIEKIGEIRAETLALAKRLAKLGITNIHMDWF